MRFGIAAVATRKAKRLENAAFWLETHKNKKPVWLMLYGLLLYKLFFKERYLFSTTEEFPPDKGRFFVICAYYMSQINALIRVEKG